MVLPFILRAEVMDSATFFLYKGQVPVKLQYTSTA